MVLLTVHGELVGITAGVVDPVAPSEQANKQTTIFGSGMKFYRRRQSFATSNKQHDESVEPMWCVEPAFLCAAAAASLASIPDVPGGLYGGIGSLLGSSTRSLV